MKAEKNQLELDLFPLNNVTLSANNERINTDDNGNVPLKNQADAILYFLQRLDIDMVDSILNNEYTYQQHQKSIFIEKLDVAFDEFLNAGDTYLNRYNGFCNSKTCNHKCKGFSFVGNKSGNYFDLIMDIKDGVVMDIYECINFKCETKSVKKNECIEIDKFEDPFII